MHTDWLKLVFVSLDGDTELACTVDVVMAQAKRIYILMTKVNKLFSFFSSRCFLKEIGSMYAMFLSSYRNTRKSCGNTPTAFLVLPNFHSCFYNSIETRSMFSNYFFNNSLSIHASVQLPNKCKFAEESHHFFFLSVHTKVDV